MGSFASKGFKKMLQSFGEKIVLAASGGTYDWVVFRTMMRIKYLEDMPEYMDGWPIDVVSLYVGKVMNLKKNISKKIL